MFVGVVGKPNSGKSTFFTASTLLDVKIAPFPFTTIEPNMGKTYVRTNCPCKEFGVKCAPKNSLCENGVRLIPVDIIDVAGLVPDAHLGKGLGLKFLDDLRAADGLIQVVDASGTTDMEGKACEWYDPVLEVKFLEEEIVYWIAGIIKRGWNKVKGGGLESLSNLLSGLKISKKEVADVVERLGLSKEKINWSDNDIMEFAREIRKTSKPILIAANKIDLPSSAENFERLKKEFPDKVIIPCCAEAELALRKGVKQKIVEYVPGNTDFKVIGNVSEKQAHALEFIKGILKKYGGTGVQEIINKLIFETLGLIVVYPVEDENKLSDHFGNILPDAFLLKKGATPLDLAYKIHGELGEKFICGVDVRTKMKIGKEKKLEMGDVVKIVAEK